jgi:hypothetical protein
MEYKPLPPMMPISACANRCSWREPFMGARVLFGKHFSITAGAGGWGRGFLLWETPIDKKQDCKFKKTFSLSSVVSHPSSKKRSMDGAPGLLPYRKEPGAWESEVRRTTTPDSSFTTPELKNVRGPVHSE